MVTKLKKLLSIVTNGTGLRGKGNILGNTNSDNHWIMSFSKEEEEKLSDVYIQGYLHYKEIAENCEWTVEDLNSLDEVCKKVLENYNWENK